MDNNVNSVTTQDESELTLRQLIERLELAEKEGFIVRDVKLKSNCNLVNDPTAPNDGFKHYKMGNTFTTVSIYLEKKREF